MSALLEHQKAMFAAITCGFEEDMTLLVVEGGVDVSARLGIYRSTFVSSLVRALRLSYPAIERLVGAEFFEGVARRFIEGHLPASASLDDYGRGFPEFLSVFPPAASHSYLADVARLEWAVSQALHAKDAAPLDLAKLNEIPEEAQAGLELVSHPSLRLLRTNMPADVLWRAVLAEDEDTLKSMDLGSGPAWLMVHRVSEEVDITRLEEAEWRFIANLGNEKIVDALETAVDIDAPALLASLLARGMFVGHHISED